MFEDIVYFSSLIVCVSLGSNYKKIEDPEMKRNYGVGVGILVACLICGHEIYHTVLMVWGNIIILKCCDKRYLHQISMAYTWTYLLYLHNNITSKYVIWLHQTMALRLVGLAFELHGASKPRGASHNKSSADDVDAMTVEPNAVDIIAYSYFFIGLHKGPYYRWKIYNDHFTGPFSTLGDCRVITEQKLKKAFICALGYLLLQMKYSTNNYYENSFYEYYGTDFRFLYNVPQLVMYFLRWQIVMMLCTAVCTETGFGVYPAKCVAQPGFGPSERYSLLELATRTSELALQQEYNFAMLKCFDNEKLIIGPKMKDTIKSWDMSTGYWFWANVYKNFRKCNKEIRSACSFFAWTVWCGPTLQQFILSSTLWVYVHLEAEYIEYYNTTGPTAFAPSTDDKMNLPWNIGFSLMRLFCLIYLTPCLIISDVGTFLRYYNSIFWMYHIIMLVLIVFAIILQKSNM